MILTRTTLTRMKSSKIFICSMVIKIVFVVIIIDITYVIIRHCLPLNTASMILTTSLRSRYITNIPKVMETTTILTYVVAPLH